MAGFWDAYLPVCLETSDLIRRVESPYKVAADSAAEVSAVRDPRAVHGGGGRKVEEPKVPGMLHVLSFYYQIIIIIICYDGGGRKIE